MFLWLSLLVSPSGISALITMLSFFSPPLFLCLGRALSRAFLLGMFRSDINDQDRGFIEHEPKPDTYNALAVTQVSFNGEPFVAGRGYNVCNVEIF